MQGIYTTVYRSHVIDPKIEKLDNQAVQLRKQIAVLSADRRQLLGELVQEALPDQKINQHALIEGHWECPDPEDGRQGTPHSPTGKCIYIAGADENCIFCGLPIERK
jgi:hypothetical protein